MRTKLFRANQATRNASVATEEQIVSRVHAQRGAHQAAAEVLRELARFEEGTPLVSGPPDFFGGAVWSGAMQRLRVREADLAERRLSCP